MHVPPILYSTATPPAPSSSCALTEGTGNTTRLTLTWTEPPSDDSIDQYCINSSPEYPSTSSLCVGSNVRTHEYRVQEGLHYNFTLFAVNCDDQNGTETAPIAVFPQGKFLFPDCLRLQFLISCSVSKMCCPSPHSQVFTTSSFDRLQYPNVDGEDLGDLVMCVTTGDRG